jgi:hypothetical protein
MDRRAAPSRMIMRDAVRWIVFVLSIAGVAGCKPRCDPSFCDGNTLHACVDEHDSEDYWKVIDCEDRFCVERGDEAFCAQEPLPRPACDGVPYLGHVCDDGELIACVHGYASTKADCGAAELCEASVGCLVHAGPDPQCVAREPAPDSACTYCEDTDAAYCDGAMRIECRDDFAVEATPCASGVCRASSDGAACVDSATPDPTCRFPNAPWPYQVCKGNAILECVGSHVIRELPCSGGTCTEESWGAGCRL